MTGLAAVAYKPERHPTMAHSHYDLPSPWTTGFKGRCPRCGEGRLFSGFLKVAQGCGFCGLRYDFENAGDGAVPFLILIIGAIGVGLGAWVLLAFDTAVWVPILVTVPVVILLTLILMPRAKGLLIALQYVNQASDSGTDSPDT
tara:strand:+ start:522 stop:953 length:432 start_codon:yes stop_codon:yes gene_type:complete